MKSRRPWSDPVLLTAEVAGWRDRWAGRPLFRVTAGRHWIRLGLTGDDRPGILLTSLPGACLALAHQGALPRPVRDALSLTPRHPLTGLLDGAVLSACAMLPDDLVAAFRLTAGDRTVYLLHQLFGSRGNTALLDDQARLLWAGHRPPHRLLGALPSPAIWEHGQADAQVSPTSPAALAHLQANLTERIHRETLTTLGRTRKSARRLVDNLTRDFDNAEKGELYRLRAETLATHLHQVRQGQPSVVLTEPRSGQPLEIPLDPALSPAANLEAWFRRARKADKGHEVVARRLADARARLAVIEEAERDLAALPADGADTERLERLQAWRADHADLLPAAKSGASRGRYGPEEPARPFRRYLVDGTWEVWVGRNNQENDELTHRASHGRDIWLHAQGVPGSHVILRTAGKPEQVPRTVLAKAAGLAALNSRARHAELVPVVYTERRYVRRPRKAPAGTAVCLREKSLFVEPGISCGVTPF